MTAQEIAVAAAVGIPALIAGVIVLLRLELWLKRRRAERDRADAAIDRFLRRHFAALDDTQQFDVPSLFDDDHPTQT